MPVGVSDQPRFARLDFFVFKKNARRIPGGDVSQSTCGWFNIDKRLAATGARIAERFGAWQEIGGCQIIERCGKGLMILVVFRNRGQDQSHLGHSRIGCRIDRLPVCRDGFLLDLCLWSARGVSGAHRSGDHRIAAVALHPHIGQSYPAIVTGVNNYGTFVRTLDPHVDGKVVKGGKGLDVGDKVTVKLLSTDPVRGFIDFAVQ